eukprot:Pgem_evm1s17379
MLILGSPFQVKYNNRRWAHLFFHLLSFSFMAYGMFVMYKVKELNKKVHWWNI